jgi:beta-glucanase (GH16 family)
VTRTDQTGQHQNVDCLVDDPGNVAVADGTLRLTARRAGAPFTCDSPYGAFTTQWTGGMVTTGRKFAQAYGRYQIRAKFPDATVAGMHGALWLYPQEHSYGAWPASGEIDVAEHRTAMADKAVPTLHYLTPTLTATADAFVTNWNCQVDASAFHTYGLDWAPGSITITVDGQTCLQKVSWLASNLLGPLSGDAPFDKPFFLLLTQGAGVGQNSPVSQTPSQGTMQVDYVRVWN